MVIAVILLNYFFVGLPVNNYIMLYSFLLTIGTLILHSTK